MGLGGKLKTIMRNWLDIQKPSCESLTIHSKLDYEANAIKNRIWYRGDPYELNQIYKQINLTDASFWSLVTKDARKVHTGLPALIVDTLSSVVVRDYNGVKIKGADNIWKEIEKDNNFEEVLKKTITDTLYIGDGAFKITIDKNVSEYPIIEFVSGEKVEVVYNRGRVKEIIFKYIYKYNDRSYVHHEIYGYGYIRNKLYEVGNDTELNINTIPQLANVIDVKYDGSFMMALMVSYYDSPKYDGRGKSIFDGKISDFDSLDEVVSQWMDAVRKGRANSYIPEGLIPRDKKSGTLLKRNAFDNNFISVKSAGIKEGDDDKIQVVQPSIPTDNYLSSYITFLDLSLQGIISPSTLGIDTKKLDNAEAQREKEKTTLHTRGIIVDKLEKIIPQLVQIVMNVYYTDLEQSIKDVESSVDFGEYANPSFEAVVETMSKAKTSGIISINKIVDELYGNSLSDDEKEEEIQRIKEEQGITDLKEPTLQEVIVDETGNSIN